jgi:hypothetical protein
MATSFPSDVLTMGIATTGFCHPGGILQLFCRQDQLISAAANSSSNQIEIPHHLQQHDQICG